jgi:hypothetical protein
MKIDEQLREFAQQIADGCGNRVDFDTVSQWPKGRLDEFIKLGVLIETTLGSTIICRQCDEVCGVEPDRVTYPDGRTVGLFYCRHQQHNIEIAPERFRQWEILPDKLSNLGYGTPVADEELTNEQAVELLGGGLSRGTISKWVSCGLLRCNGRSGRDRRVLKSSVLLLSEQRQREQVLHNAKERGII